MRSRSWHLSNEKVYASSQQAGQGHSRCHPSDRFPVTTPHQKGMQLKPNLTDRNACIENRKTSTKASVGGARVPTTLPGYGRKSCGNWNRHQTCRPERSFSSCNVATLVNSKMANCAPSTVGFASGGGKPQLKN